MSAGSSLKSVTVAPATMDLTAPSKKRRMSSGLVAANLPRYMTSLMPFMSTTVVPVALPMSASFTSVFTRHILSSTGETGDVSRVSPSGVATR